jgi:hypothetical protein
MGRHLLCAVAKADWEIFTKVKKFQPAFFFLYKKEESIKSLNPWL